MKLKELYKAAIEIGIEADPRGKTEVRKVLDNKKKEFDKLSDDDKKFYDKDLLENPYPDSRILAGDPEAEIAGILTGIDLEASEAILADQLNSKGKNINLLLTHHPEGKALVKLHEVMQVQADEWFHFGVPVNIGDVLIDERMAEVQRNLMPINHNRAVDTAKILGLNYMSAHTVADNQVNQFVQKYLDDKKPDTVGDIVKVLREIPEYEHAAYDGSGPMILVGSASKRPGEIFVDMTGGTEGPVGAIEKLADAGVGTIVQMHLGDKLRKKAEKHKINVVIAGHIASDNIGLNLLLDKLQSKGLTDNILTTSGFIRISRK
ncbi:MAG: NGG1p interacting factor NIF3 [Actinobacteria bacterium]|nr:MAG: NGG1p interacting factor NIF3 [Actinomycetota bacterium]